MLIYPRLDLVLVQLIGLKAGMICFQKAGFKIVECFICLFDGYATVVAAAAAAAAAAECQVCEAALRMGDEGPKVEWLCAARCLLNNMDTRSRTPSTWSF